MCMRTCWALLGLLCLDRRSEYHHWSLWSQEILDQWRSLSWSTPYKTELARFKEWFVEPNLQGYRMIELLGLIRSTRLSKQGLSAGLQMMLYSSSSLNFPCMPRFRVFKYPRFKGLSISITKKFLPWIWMTHYSLFWQRNSCRTFWDQSVQLVVTASGLTD